jgi:lipopolysaccharide export system permease protein
VVSLSLYVLRQHLLPFVLGFSLIVFVLVLDVVLQMLDQVLSKGLSAGLALQLFRFNLAWIIALAVPMAVLVAVLMAYGRMAADNEILALKASGISFTRVLIPTLVTACLLAVLMVWFNDRVLPDWNHKARNLAVTLKRAKAALVLKQKEGVFIRDLGPYSLLVRDVDEEANLLYDLTLYDTGHPGPPTTLRAARGKVEIFDDGGYIRLMLEDGEAHEIDAQDPSQFTRSTFSRQVVHIRDSKRDLSPNYRSSYRSDREMDVRAMLRAVDGLRSENQRALGHIDSTAKAFVESLATAAPAEEGMRTESRRVANRLHKQWRLFESRQRRANAFLVEIHKKYSIAVACIVFVLVGAPLGALVRARGAAVSVTLSLVFFFAYWMFLIGGEELADRGFIPPWTAMWAPNVVFGVIGAMLLRAVTLDRGFLDTLLIWRRKST